MMRFLDENEVIANCQPGFIKKKSYFTNLLMALEDWISSVDQGHGVDIVYLDFSKVFDSVPRQRFIQKLASYRFSGWLLCWHKRFLSDLYQRVILNSSPSDWCPVTSSVTQGSVLGPLIFTFTLIIYQTSFRLTEVSLLMILKFTLLSKQSQSTRRHWQYSKLYA